MRLNRWFSLSICILLIGGCTVTSIDANNAANINQRRDGPLPDTFTQQLEQQINRLSRQLFLTRSKHPLNYSHTQIGQQYAIQTKQQQIWPSNPFKPEEIDFYCVAIQVNYQLNYHNTFRDAETQQYIYISNTHHYQRTDTLCGKGRGHKIHYLAGTSIILK